MTSTDPFVPPAAEELPAGVLDSAADGASALDAWARDPRGRNFLAHALVQLARDGWLRTEVGDGFEPVRDRSTPGPTPAGQAPATDQTPWGVCPNCHAAAGPDCDCPPAIDRIPLAHSVRYVAHGLPEVPNQYGAGVLAPSEITLTYRSAPDSQLGRVHAYVAGRIWVDGQELPLLSGGLYGQHYDDGLDGWPEWLAEEARLHDPDAPAAGVAPAPDQTAPAVWVDGHPQLEAIAAAVWEQCRTEDTSLVVDDPRNIAVAALAALPASVDRADVLDQAAAIVFALDFDELRATTQFDSHRQAWELGTIDAANKLRRVAAEAPHITGNDASREPVQHAPGVAVLCPDCRAKGRAVCMNDRTPVQCTASVLRKPHGPHGWEPQPGMAPVPCDGYPQPKEA